MKVTVRQVSKKRELRQFVRFPNLLYKDNPYYVPQLEQADLEALDPKRNHAFEVCEACYWMAFNVDGKAVGRIAGIVNHAYNAKTGLKQARFSYLDFIDDNDVVDALFSSLETWARSKGMTVLSGPEGFLEFDVAGVLVEGYDKLPTAYGKYNHPYYETQMLRCGFVKQMDWIESVITRPDELPAAYEKALRIVPERTGLKLMSVKSKKELKPYIPQVFNLMNRAYSKISGYSELTQGQKDDLLKQFIPNVNLDFFRFMLNPQGQMVAFCIWMPSLSKALQKCHGRLFPFGFIHILHALRHNDRMDTLLVGVDEEYRNMGLYAVMFASMWPGLEKMGIRYLETTRELEDNNGVKNLMNRFEYETVKRARCYTKPIR